MKKSIHLLLSLEFRLKFYESKVLFNLIIVFMLFPYGLTNPVLAQKNTNTPKSITTRNEDAELKITEIDLGYKKINVETYKFLKKENEEAKIIYAKLSFHPKLITKLQGENVQFVNTLKQYKIINLTYVGKEIRFNSLFIKTIIENPKVHYLSINPAEAFLYTDNDLDIVVLSNQLNDISLTPIKVIEQPELKYK